MSYADAVKSIDAEFNRLDLAIENLQGMFDRFDQIDMYDDFLDKRETA